MVVNVDNGPSSSVDSTHVSFINGLKQKGFKMLGYILRLEYGILRDGQVDKVLQRRRLLHRRGIHEPEDLFFNILQSQEPWHVRRAEPRHQP